MSHRKHQLPSAVGNQSGFTIVELMIASLVFSVILIVITIGVLSFTHAYYSGINSSATQNTVRNTISIVTRAIEFSGGATPTDGSSGFFCAGNDVFVFNLGQQYKSGDLTHNPGLYEMTAAAGCPSAAPAPAGGRQLLGENMRITELRIEQLSGTNSYTVSLHVAYGDGDQLCNTSIAGATLGGCLQSAPDYGATDNVAAINAAPNDTVTCKQQSGYQFCATAGLTTTVAARVSTM